MKTEKLKHVLKIKCGFKIKRLILNSNKIQPKARAPRTTSSARTRGACHWFGSATGRTTAGTTRTNRRTALPRCVRRATSSAPMESASPRRGSATGISIAGRTTTLTRALRFVVSFFFYVFLTSWRLIFVIKGDFHCLFVYFNSILFILVHYNFWIVTTHVKDIYLSH